MSIRAGLRCIQLGLRKMKNVEFQISYAHIGADLTACAPKSQWRRANAQLARHCQACALSSFTTQSSTVQKPHAERAGWRVCAARSCARYSHPTHRPRTCLSPWATSRSSVWSRKGVCKSAGTAQCMCKRCARVRAARTYRLQCAPVCGFFYIEIGHLSAQNCHISSIRGAKKSSRSPTARSIPHAQKGLNHVLLDNPDRGSSPNPNP